MEAFHFLPRDELERCGQVCHKWRELIERSQGSLPLRFVEVRTVSLRGIVDKWPKIPVSSGSDGLMGHDLVVKKTRYPRLSDMEPSVLVSLAQ